LSEKRNNLMRILVLCTHNSARSQIAEGWLKHYAQELRLNAQIYSAGSEKTFVKEDAIKVMKENAIDISQHSSKTIDELDNKWNFDIVWTVCDNANEACPIYPASTTRLHSSFEDPSGQSLKKWREVRDAIGQSSKKLIKVLLTNNTPSQEDFILNKS